MHRFTMSFAAGALFISCLASSSRLLADSSESLESLRAAKLKAAQQWWDVVMDKFKAGTQEYSGMDIFRAAKALKEPQIDLATTKQQRIKALEAYRDRMKDIYRMADTWFKAGYPNGGADRVAEAQINLLQAKIWLKEEEAKP
jgi:hypothetical protein